MDINIAINEKIVRKVNRFVDKLTYNLDKNAEDVIDFIQETKSNMLYGIQDLMQEGHSEEDAFTIAVNRFGDLEALRYELNHLYKVNKIIRKSLLKIAIVVLVIGSVLSIAGITYDRHIQSIYYKTILTPLYSKAGSENNPVSDDLKSTVKSIIDNNSFLEAGGIYTSKIEKLSDGNYMYGSTEPYIKDINFKFNYVYLTKKQTNENKYFADNVEGLLFNHKTDEVYFRASSNNNSDVVINIAYKVKLISSWYYLICKALILAYWIIFAVWGGMNILYESESKNKFWIIVVTITNIFGYLAYKAIQIRMNKKRYGKIITEI